MINLIIKWVGGVLMGDGRDKIYLSDEQIARLKRQFGDEMPEAIKTYRQRIYYVSQDLTKLDSSTRRCVEICLDLPSLSDAETAAQLRGGTSEGGLEHVAGKAVLAPATSRVSEQEEGEASSSSDAASQKLSPSASLEPTEVLQPDDSSLKVVTADVPSEVASQATENVSTPVSEVSVAAEPPRSDLPATPSELVVMAGLKEPETSTVQPTPEASRKTPPAPVFGQATREGYGPSRGSHAPTRSGPPAAHSPTPRTREADRSSPEGYTRPSRSFEREVKSGPQNQLSTAPEPQRKPNASVVRWKGAHATIVGASHLKQMPPTPCQDAATTQSEGRAMVCVADGAGSSILSHLGSDAVVRQLRQLVTSLDPLLATVLDEEAEPSQTQVNLYAQVLICHAVGALQELSRIYRHPLEAFRCTLLFAVVGKCRLLWLKVGDGGLVVEQDGTLITLGAGGKGEYANQTTFLSEQLTLTDAGYGVVSMQNVAGLAAFTDGAGEKLLSSDGAQVAGQVKKFLTGLRDGSFNTHRLFEFLAEPAVWKGTTGDDRGLALLSRLEA